MTLLDRERETYETIWSLPAYASHSPGEIHLPLFLDMAHPKKDETILDAGCGTGKGALALKAFGFEDVRLCDLTETGLVPEAKSLPFKTACLWEPLLPKLGYVRGYQFDWVYCCDVLEHVPPTFTMLVVSQLVAAARKGVFLSIALMPDQFGALVGKRLHQSVQNFTAWRDQLATVGTLVESRDLLTTGVYLVKAK